MSDPNPPFHFFGIRHHGPGSARSLLAALRRLQPDLLLMEGPPEAEAILPLAGHAQMKPPVAMLMYGSVEGENSPRAAFFPFAEFSPEWQALAYAREQALPVRLIDLPQAVSLADNWQADPTTAEAEPENEAGSETPTDTGNGAEPVTAESESAPDTDGPEPELDATPAPLRHDPIGLLAQAAGYHDSERFWEHLVEQQPHADGVFAAIAEAMSAVRAALPEPAGRHAEREACREAQMRQCLRQAQKDGFQRIAVVCGAWHVPALQDLKSTRKDDTARLKGLAKLKVQAAWIPWTHGRLQSRQGYGAGIESPGWYSHLWEHYRQEAPDPEAISSGWLAKFAQALRAEGLDASSAQLIDASRLISALAVLRGRHLPDLDDLQEAIISVLHHGDALPSVLSQRLLVGEKLGEVPDDMPALPLQNDFQKQCKSLRLKVEADSRDLQLDLREEQGLAKSRFLHRLRLLGIPWGQPLDVSGKGTFKEAWRLQWQPDFSLKLVESAIWGQTLDEAAARYVQHHTVQATDIPALARLVEQVLVADLGAALPPLIDRIMALSTRTADISHLIAALEPLANAWRYGNVRQTRSDALAAVTGSFVLRICIGLPAAVSSLNDEAAQLWLGHLKTLDRVLTRLDEAELLREWHQVLLRLTDQSGLHGLLAGWCCRVSAGHELLTAEAAAQRFSRALSAAWPVEHTAAWFEGFLAGQGLSLIHDPTLWALVDQWLLTLTEEHFVQILPLLRRTVATFTAPERAQLAGKAQGGGNASGASAAAPVNSQRAARVLPVLAAMLGLPAPSLPEPISGGAA